MASLVTPSYDRLMDFFTDFRFQSIEAIMMIAFAGSFLTDFDFILDPAQNQQQVFSFWFHFIIVYWG